MPLSQVGGFEGGSSALSIRGLFIFLKEGIMGGVETKAVYRKLILGKKFRVYGTLENPLFLAKEVAEWIDYSKTSEGYYNVAKMLKLVDNCDKIIMKIEQDDTITACNSISAGNPNKWFITENGLYELLMKTDKPIAKQFKKEVKKLLHDLRVGNKAVVSLKATPEEKQTAEYKAVRKHSKEIRNSFTDELKTRGYTKQYEYINTTRSMKKALNITNRKDEMTTQELRLVKASEYLAECMLVDEYGFKEVNPVCSYASESVINVIEAKPRLKLA